MTYWLPCTLIPVLVALLDIRYFGMGTSIRLSRSSLQPTRNNSGLPENPLWYKAAGAIVYPCADAWRLI